MVDFAKIEKWTATQEGDLQRLFLGGLDPGQIARYMGRTPMAIVSRLERMGLVIQGRDLSYYKATPYVTIDELRRMQQAYKNGQVG